MFSIRYAAATKADLDVARGPSPLATTIAAN